MLSDQSVRLIDVADEADLSSPGTKRVRGGRESPNHIDRDRRTRHDTKFPTRHIPSHSLILAAGESTEAPRRVARTGTFPRARQEPVEGSPIRSSSGQLRSLLSYSGGLNPWSRIPQHVLAGSRPICFYAGHVRRASLGLPQRSAADGSAYGSAHRYLAAPFGRQR